MKLVNLSSEKTKLKEPVSVTLNVMNKGERVWHNTPNSNKLNHVLIGYHVKNLKDGSIVDGRLGIFRRKLDPVDSVTVSSNISSMKNVGQYEITFDVLQEGEAWFARNKENVPVKAHVEIID